MNHLIGFVIWWIIVGVIWGGVYLFEKQTMKIIGIFRKYAQMIMYMFCMLIGYLIAFLLAYIWNFFQWKCSAIAGAIILVIVWKIAYICYGLIWRKKDKHTGNVEYNLELLHEEKQWCNSISIFGMAAMGIIFSIQTDVWDYFEIVSMAFSVWIGSYISIQNIQQRYTIKEVRNNWKKEFSVKSKAVPVMGTIFMSAFVCFVALDCFEEHRIVFDELALGFAIGAALFVLGVVIVQKTHNQST